MNLACVKHFGCRYKKLLKTSDLMFKERTNETRDVVLSIKTDIDSIVIKMFEPQITLGLSHNYNC